MEVVLGLGPQRAGTQFTETMKKQMPGKQVIARSVETMQHWEELERTDFAGFLLPTYLGHIICSSLWWQLPSCNRTFIYVLFNSCVCVCVWVQSLRHVWLFSAPWTVAHQAPLSMGFSRQEYWSGLPVPSPGALPDPGIEPPSPAWAGRFFYH